MRVWHKTASEAETLGNTQPWYFQPESAEESQVTPVLPPAPVTVTPTHFEPDAAERILARAGLLQETHRQNLSKEQVEAIAAEIGIAPEFVRLAIEQEAMGVLPQQETVLDTVAFEQDAISGRQFLGVSAGVIALYGVITSVVMTHASDRLGLVVPAVFFFPATFALALGMLSRRRGWAAASGAAIAITAIVVAFISFSATGGNLSLSAQDLQVFALMIGTGTLLGTSGAQARRLIRRRRVKNQARRIVRRTKTP